MSARFRDKDVSVTVGINLDLCRVACSEPLELEATIRQRKQLRGNDQIVGDTEEQPDHRPDGLWSQRSSVTAVPAGPETE